MVLVITSAAPTAVPNLVQIRSWGLMDKWVKYNNFFYLYLYLGNSPTGQTRRRIFTLHGSNDADSRKDVHFGGFVDTAPHFGDEIFKSNWRNIASLCYRNCCIDLSQILHNDRDHKVVIVGGPNTC